MALTIAQEAYLAKLADKGLAEEAYAVKVAELTAALSTAQDAVDQKLVEDVGTKTGAEQKQAIADLRAAIAADPEVIKIRAELEAL